MGQWLLYSNQALLGEVGRTPGFILFSIIINFYETDPNL